MCVRTQDAFLCFLRLFCIFITEKKNLGQFYFSLEITKKCCIFAFGKGMPQCLLRGFPFPATQLPIASFDSAIVSSDSIIATFDSTIVGCD